MEILRLSFVDKVLQVTGGRLIAGRPFFLGGIVFIMIGYILSVATIVFQIYSSATK